MPSVQPTMTTLPHSPHLYYRHLIHGIPFIILIINYYDKSQQERRTIEKERALVTATDTCLRSTATISPFD